MGIKGAYHKRRRNQHPALLHLNRIDLYALCLPCFCQDLNPFTSSSLTQTMRLDHHETYPRAAQAKLSGWVEVQPQGANHIGDTRGTCQARRDMYTRGRGGEGRGGRAGWGWKLRGIRMTGSRGVRDRELHGEKH